MPKQRKYLALHVTPGQRSHPVDLTLTEPHVKQTAPLAICRLTLYHFPPETRVGLTTAPAVLLLIEPNVVTPFFQGLSIIPFARNSMPETRVELSTSYLKFRSQQAF
jgi:hypothetical protein